MLINGMQAAVTLSVLASENDVEIVGVELFIGAFTLQNIAKQAPVLSFHESVLNGTNESNNVLQPQFMGNLGLIDPAVNPTMQ